MIAKTDSNHGKVIGGGDGALVMEPGIVDQWLSIGAERRIYVGYHQQSIRILPGIYDWVCLLLWLYLHSW